jgi:hypothetical protein
MLCGSQVTSSGGNSIAVLNMGFNSGITKWQLQVDKDVANDECTCFGAVVKPLANFNYDSTTSFMYRGYNGALYGSGKTMGDKAKVGMLPGQLNPLLHRPTVHLSPVTVMPLLPPLSPRHPHCRAFHLVVFRGCYHGRGCDESPPLLPSYHCCAFL